MSDKKIKLSVTEIRALKSWYYEKMKIKSDNEQDPTFHKLMNNYRKRIEELNQYEHEVAGDIDNKDLYIVTYEIPEAGEAYNPIAYGPDSLTGCKECIKATCDNINDVSNVTYYKVEPLKGRYTWRKE